MTICRKLRCQTSPKFFPNCLIIPTTVNNPFDDLFSPQREHTPEPHITSADTRTGDQNANSAGSSAIHEVTKTCQSNSAVQPETDHEFADDGGGGRHEPSTSKCDSPAPSITSQSLRSRLDGEEPSSVDQEAVSTPDRVPDEQPTELRTGETVPIVDHNQNHIEAPQAEPEEVPEPSAPSEADRDQIVDENDNVSCVQPAPRTAENLSMHCNGKAVSAVSYTHLTLPTIYSV